MKRNLKMDADIKSFVEKIDVDYQAGFVEEYSKIGDSEIYGGKHCGSDAEHKGSEMIAEYCKAIGLSNVELVPCETSRYQFNDASITLAGSDKIIKPFGYVSPGGFVEAELINAGKATKDEYAALDAEGKIAIVGAMGTLEGACLAGQIHESMLNKVAAIVIYAVEDVLDEDTIRVQPPNVIPDIPIVGVSKRDADWLIEQIDAGNKTAKLDVDAEFIPDGGTTYNVVAEIPGTISDERIIYTAHLDHYFRCLQDNMSSCSTLLGIAKAMIESGYKPNRTITFAFHGSHETGGMDTRYPYIFGSYKLTHESKTEWSGKSLVNFNFEYTALRLKKLQVIGYMGTNSIVESFYDYAPALNGKGFESIEKKQPESEYYMLSWSDSISYHAAGIPTFCNDCILEQYYEGVGPYVGRDHSNMDNWDIFDKDILADVTAFYGSAGIYVDSMPYIDLDFREQVNRIRNEINFDMLEKTGADVNAYIAAVKAFEEAAGAAREKAISMNERYVEELAAGTADINQWFEQADKFNETMLAVYKMMADDLDRINQYDFISLETVKYLQVIEMLEGTKASLEEGNVDAAFEALAGADLVVPSYYFSEEVAEHMRKQICAPSYIGRRTWAAGRELHVATMYDLVAAFKADCESGDFSGTYALLDKYIADETSYIPPAAEREINALMKMKEKLERI